MSILFEYVVFDINLTEKHFKKLGGLTLIFGFIYVGGSKLLTSLKQNVLHS